MIVRHIGVRSFKQNAVKDGLMLHRFNKEKIRTNNGQHTKTIPMKIKYSNTCKTYIFEHTMHCFGWTIVRLSSVKTVLKTYRDIDYIALVYQFSCKHFF